MPKRNQLASFLSFVVVIVVVDCRVENNGLAFFILGVSSSVHPLGVSVCPRNVSPSSLPNARRPCPNLSLPTPRTRCKWLRRGCAASATAPRLRSLPIPAAAAAAAAAAARPSCSGSQMRFVTPSLPPSLPYGIYASALSFPRRLTLPPRVCARVHG